MAMTTNLNAKADQEGFIAVYPDALGSPPSWDMYGDVGFISALIDSLLSEYALDTMRIYATGYSNGAFMAHVLAAELSKRIAAVSMVAGGLMITYWWEFSLDRPIPTIHFHARDDAVVPYYGGQGTAPVEEMLQSWVTQNGCTEGPDSFWHTDAALRQIWSNPSNEVENVLWSTDEGGHYNWPRLTSPHKISANDLMWDFFTGHPMPAQELWISETGLKECSAFDVQGIMSGTASVRFTLDQACRVTIVLYDVTGSKIAILSDGLFDAGQHEFEFDASGLPGGVYFCRMNPPPGWESPAGQGD